MSNNPINLGLRFILEMCALAAFLLWATETVNGAVGYLLGLVLIVIAASIWGMFRVPGDTSHKGDAAVAIPGLMRLGIEAVFFIVATIALVSVGERTLGFIFAAIVIGHYLASYDRILWMLKQT